MTVSEALKRAHEAGLDLVEIAPNANPPITKITEYGRFKYIQEKKEREQHKKQKEVELKSVRISLGIDAHDKEIKAGLAKEFLAEGNKVVVEMRLRGREKANKAFAEKKFREFVALLGDIAYEQPLKWGMRGPGAVVGKRAGKQPSNDVQKIDQKTN